MTGLDVEAVLRDHDLAEGRRDGRLHCCCGWASDPLSLVAAVPRADQYRAHVAAVLRVEIESALGEAWDEGWDARTASAHSDRPNDHRANPYRPTLAATEGDT